MNYIVTTNKGNVYDIREGKAELVLRNDTTSIYTNDPGIRRIKKYDKGYLVVKSESILIWNDAGGTFTLPGLVDIKDIAFGDNFVVILSGLRDSVYILTRDMRQVLICFNINEKGEIELFKERQKQCREIPSEYFQIFYCPHMNNFHHFDRLELKNEILSIIPAHDSGGKIFDINLFSFFVDRAYFGDILIPEHQDKLKELEICVPGEVVTDYVEI